MKDSFLKSKLIGPKTIRIVLFTTVNKDDNTVFTLIKDSSDIIPMELNKQSSVSGVNFFEFTVKEEIVLGHRYDITITNFGSDALDVSDATTFPDFDNRYFYDGDDLGMTYQKESTTFVLWAPLASSVILKYFCEGKWHLLAMNREDKGIYRLKVDGNLDGVKYRYVVTNSGVVNEVTDPYAKGSTQNGEDSVVIDFAKTKMEMNTECLPKIKSYCDAIIYETHVRDLTVQEDTTDIVNKGLFLGMVEPGRKTVGGHPAGFDHIVSLGITHLQLLPVFDYKTVDETNFKKIYNWGYDPAQYFVPEGSYASVPNDPYSRIIDFKKLVAAYHKSGIRINLDVVYNHVYNYQFSVFEKLVPNYFYRRWESGKLTNGSGCGNDIATERPMIRKLIVDSCVFWLNEYDIDGYRFDLMGLIDIETMKEIETKTRAIKKDFMLYGEGWNIPTAIDEEDRATILNSFKLPSYAFFNDSFRNIVKGPSGHEIFTKGYMLGNSSYREGFKYSYMSSAISFCFDKRFLFPHQSINYVECHDNETLFDKLELALGDTNIFHRLDRIKAINAAIMFSYGIPFYHMGQEFSLTKKGHDNTYNLGDKYNEYNYNILDEHYDMVVHFASLCKIRKELSFLRLDNVDDIEDLVYFTDLDHGAIMIDYINEEKIKPFLSFKVFVNPSDETIYYELDDYHQVYLSIVGLVPNNDVHIKHLMLTPRSFVVLVKK